MIAVAVAMLIGQGLIALVLWKVMKTFGVYAESLLYTHQQNLQIRQHLAEQENDIAAREALKKYPLPKQENA